MIKRISSLIAAFGGVLMAMAVPADPEPVVVTNPDGTTVEVRLFGDEDFSYMTDITGEKILEYNSEGYLVEMVRDGAPMRNVRADVVRLRGQERKPHRLAPLDENGRTSFPTVGEVKSVVILVEYSDTEFVIPEIRETIERFCNEEGYNSYGSRGSVRDYFRETSNGKFTPEFDVFGPVSLPETSKYYTGGDRYKKFYEAISYSLKELDPEVDFSKYDNDGDGVIDNIYFFYAGHGQNDTNDTSTIWPHQDDFRKHPNGAKEELYIDGVMMGTYACSSELKGKVPEGEEGPWLNGIGTFVHEFGHVLGIPDLYDTTSAMFGTRSPGKWSVMDSGSYNLNGTCPPKYSCYEQWFCHWLELEEMVEGTRYELASISNTQTPRGLSMRVPSAGGNGFNDEWFFFETRTAHGWDEGLGDEGLLVWRVNFDADKWSSNKVNTNSNPNLELIQPNRLRSHAVWPGQENLYTFICPGVGTSLKPQSKASADFQPIIDTIVFDKESGVVSFGYNCMTRGNEVTQFNAEPYADQELRNVTLSWDPVEGATDYLLTVTCYDEDNWFRVVNYWDSKSTSGRTTVTIEDIMEKFMKFEMTATVRVVMGVPSTAESKSIKFTPEKLSNSGVGEISSEAVGVYGSCGFIVAPEEAEVYDLQGRLRDRNHLESGLYIVRLNGKGIKTYVK